MIGIYDARHFPPPDGPAPVRVTVEVDEECDPKYGYAYKVDAWVRGETRGVSGTTGRNAANAEEAKLHAMYKAVTVLSEFIAEIVTYPERFKR